MTKQIIEFLQKNKLDLYDIIDKEYKYLIKSWERPKSWKEDIKDLIFKDFINDCLQDEELEKTEEEMSVFVDELENEIFEMLELDYF